MTYNPNPAYDPTTGTQKTSQLGGPETLDGTVLVYDETNLSDQTILRYVDLGARRQVSVDFTVLGGGAKAMTFEMSDQDDGTAEASVEYFDVTNEYTGAANHQTSKHIRFNKPTIEKWLKIKVVLTGAAANATIRFRVRTGY